MGGVSLPRVVVVRDSQQEGDIRGEGRGAGKQCRVIGRGKDAITSICSQTLLEHTKGGRTSREIDG